MPRVPLYQLQADILESAEYTLLLSELLHDNILWSDDVIEDIELEDDDEDWEADDSAFYEALQLSAIDWAEFAASLTGNGSRGSYNSWPKCEDYFRIALQAPDCWFRHMFQCATNL